MRRSVIAAWMLVVALFAMMSLAAHLPAREPSLPPGVTIPSATGLQRPALEDGCLGSSDFVALRAC